MWEFLVVFLQLYVSLQLPQNKMYFKKLGRLGHNVEGHEC